MLTIASKKIEPMPPSMGRERIGIDIVIADADPSDADVGALMEREARDALLVSGASEAHVEVFALDGDELDAMTVAPCGGCGAPVGERCDRDCEGA